MPIRTKVTGMWTKVKTGGSLGMRSEAEADMAVNTQAKVRVQFEFTLEALARLDALKEVTDAPTRAEIVRKALRLYEWFVNEARSDNTIMSVDRNGELVSQFPASLLMG